MHLLCGFNGADKSTLARRLAEDLPARRFSLDERMIERYPLLDYATEEYGARAVDARAALWGEASLLLAAGNDVVLDWNC